MEIRFGSRRASGESARRSTGGGGGSLALGCFGVLATVIGIVLAVMLANKATRAVKASEWKPTPAVVQSSRPVINRSGHNDKKPYGLSVRYRYEFDGRRYVSDRVAFEARRWSDYSQVQRRLLEWAPGAEITCYVDPEAPEEAVLVRPGVMTMAAPLLATIPIMIGLGLLYGAFRLARKMKTAEESISDRASRSGSNRTGRAAGLVIFPVFVLVGCVGTYFLLGRPLMRMLGSKGWSETPCVIISSHLVVHEDSDGDTYSADILYEYDFEGRTLRSNRYGFLGGSSSARSHYNRLVREHPPGKKTVCYVNPDDPVETVLSRNMPMMMWFGLIPLVFAVIGFGGLFHMLVSSGTSSSSTVSSPPFGKRVSWSAAADQVLPSRGPVELKPTSSRKMKLLGLIVIALFWNGIVSVFLYHIVTDWMQGRAQWFPAAFLSIFVVVGIGLVFGAIYQFLALFTPVPRLTISSAAPRLGEPFELAYEITGNVYSLREFTIVLEGREEATYTVGTDTRTDKETFAHYDLVRADTPIEMARGNVAFVLPPDTMHSFTAPHNKIIWEIQVHGVVDRWPDAKDEYRLEVRPQSTEGRA